MTQSLDDKSDKTKKDSDTFEGEIKIDHTVHTDKPEKTVETIPDKPVEAKDPTPKPTIKPAHEKHIEPLHQIEPIDEPLPEQNIAQPEPVHVPGGVTEAPQNPNTFFTSKYRGQRSRHINETASPIQPQNTPIYGGINPAAMPQNVPVANTEQHSPGRIRLLIISALVITVIFVIGMLAFMYNRVSTSTTSVYRDSLNRASKALTNTESTNPVLNQLRIIDSSGGDTSTVSSEDIIEISNQIAEPLGKYVFSSNEDTRIFTDELFVDEDITDSATLYRYSVSINQPNFDQFCQDVSQLASENAKIQDLSNSISSAADSVTKVNEFCTTLGNAAANDYDVEITTDAKTKTIKAIKFTDKSDQNSFVEFAQVDS